MEVLHTFQPNRSAGTSGWAILVAPFTEAGPAKMPQAICERHRCACATNCGLRLIVSSQICVSWLLYLTAAVRSKGAAMVSSTSQQLAPLPPQCERGATFSMTARSAEVKLFGSFP